MTPLFYHTQNVSKVINRISSGLKIRLCVGLSMGFWVFVQALADCYVQLPYPLLPLCRGLNCCYLIGRRYCLSFDFGRQASTGCQKIPRISHLFCQFSKRLSSIEWC